MHIRGKIIENLTKIFYFPAVIIPVHDILEHRAPPGVEFRVIVSQAEENANPRYLSSAALYIHMARPVSRVRVSRGTVCSLQAT